MTSTGASGASDSEESADQYDPIRKLAMVQLQPPRNPNRPFTAFSIKDILGHRHANSSGRESNGARRSEHTVSDVFEPSTGSVVVVSVTDDDDDTDSGRTVTASPPGTLLSKSHSTNNHNSHSRYHHYHHHHRHHHHNEQHNHSKSHNNTNSTNSDKNSPDSIIITDASQRLISHNNSDNNNNNNNNSNNNHNNKRVGIVLASSEHIISKNSDYPGEKDHYHHPHSRLHNPHGHLHPHHPKNIIISTPSPPVVPAPLTPPTPPTPPTPQLLHNHNNNLSLKTHTQHHVHQLPLHRGSRLLGTTTTTALSSPTTTTTTTTVNGARIVRPWDTGPESDNNTSSDIDGDEEINVDDDDDTPIPSIVKNVSPLDALMEMANKTFEGLETSDAVDAKRREQAALFGKHQPPKKRRKSRTAFTNQQIYELEKRFLYQKYLTPADRDEIALSLGLTNAQVITWFQNRRAKLKRDLEEMKNDVEHAEVVTPRLDSLLVKSIVKKTIDCDSLSQQPMMEDEDEDCHAKDSSVTS